MVDVNLKCRITQRWPLGEPESMSTPRLLLATMLIYVLPMRWLVRVEVVDDVSMKAPRDVSKGEIWEALGRHANEVGEAEGVLFTDCPLVIRAVDDYDKIMKARND